MSFPVPDSPPIGADAADLALQEYFLANADRGDHAANDGLIAEMLRRMRARRAAGGARLSRSNTVNDVRLTRWYRVEWGRHGP